MTEQELVSKSGFKVHGYIFGSRLRRSGLVGPSYRVAASSLRFAVSLLRSRRGVSRDWSLFVKEEIRVCDFEVN